MKSLLIAIIVLVLLIPVYSQNIAISDDNTYTADSSAMLDVKSITKGMLVPRMTSVQRTSIVSPATGLLVFDTNENVFYYYTGTVWTNMSTGQLWSKNGNYVYLTNTDENVGIGVTAPDNKLLVKADATTGIDESIFAVLNNNGDTVFAVYQEGVRIWVDDNGGTKANGSRGGFAVGGFSPTKVGITNEYLRVTPDSVRIYIDDSYIPAKANGSRGGFAVGGFNPVKGSPTDNYLFVQDDSTRIYVNSDEGFAIDNIMAGSEGRFMDLTPDNYFIGHQAGDSISTGLFNTFIGYQSGYSDTSGSNNIFMGYMAGFGNKDGINNVFLGNYSGYSNRRGVFNICIGNYSGEYLDSAMSNIFIGDEAGRSNNKGNFNVFIGDLAGNSNTIGQKNVFLGGSSGITNFDGNNNVFIGELSGGTNFSGNSNIFIGQESGASNQIGHFNTFLGYQSGYSNSIGESNTYIGYQAGYANVGGMHNTFIGRLAGENNTGDYNVFIGTEAGRYETSSYTLAINAVNSLSLTPPLIYGIFDNNPKRMVVIDGDFTNNINNRTFFVNGDAGGLFSWFVDSDKRLKKSIKTIENPLDKVLNLRGVNFYWKDTEKYNDKLQMGFIAQEAEKNVPEVVDKKGGQYSMSYAPITALLVEAIKEQQKIIEELKKENELFKADAKKIRDLQKQVDLLNENLNLKVKR